jgi:hypothetical protein
MQTNNINKNKNKDNINNNNNNINEDNIYSLNSPNIQINQNTIEKKFFNCFNIIFPKFICFIISFIYYFYYLKII